MKSQKIKNTKFNSYKPYTCPQTIKEISKPLLENYLSMGKYTNQLENKIKDLMNVKYVILTNSGTSALMMASLALNITKDSKVLLPNLSWIATQNPIYIIGSKTNYYDSNSHNESPSIESILSMIKKYKPNFLVLNHMNGVCSYDQELHKIINKNKIKVIEDAAQAFPLKINKQYCGTKYDIGCFSMSITKLIHMVYGGFCTTNNREHYEKLLKIRNNGVDINYHKKKYTSLKGLNFKTSDVHSIIGLANLKKKEFIINQTKMIYKIYCNFLNNKKIQLINFNLNYQLPTYIQAKVDDKLKFMKFCNANNIEIHLGLNTISNNLSHDIKKNTKLNNSISLCSILVRLPSGPGYKKSEIIQICKQLNKY